ncbi:MAG TPA: hypothetical protein VFD46_14200 [Chryseolinea sp.]|nr:hypothetical protein [Chryseolinea sp.]
MKTCIEPDCDNMVEGRTDYCASHGRAKRKLDKQASQPAKEKKPIKKVSDKMAALLEIYYRKRAMFIQGKKCAIYPNQKATQVHHKKGREGYADLWAKENDIILLLDERFWLPVSMDGHEKIGREDEWAKARGFSLPRLEVLK